MLFHLNLCLLFSCQICDSVGLAKQIALHSEIVSVFMLGHKRLVTV